MTLPNLRGYFCLFFLLFACFKIHFNYQQLEGVKTGIVLKVKKKIGAFAAWWTAIECAKFLSYFFFLPLVEATPSTQLHNPAPLNINKALVPEWFWRRTATTCYSPHITAAMSYSVSELMATGAEQQVGTYLCLLRSAHAQQLSTGDEGLV